MPDANQNQPVGSGSYVVRDGDCMLSIAAQHGHVWETLWNHADNAEIKDARKDPSTLLAGDRITVPDIRLKEESRATEARHRFRKKGVPAKIKIRLLDDGEPRDAVSYRLVIDGRIIEGQTDSDGFLEAAIAPDARDGELILDRDDGGRDHFRFALGTLAPIGSDVGHQRRLQNLGFNVDEPEKAVTEFQHKNGLDESGAVNDETQNKIKEASGQ